MNMHALAITLILLTGASVYGYDSPAGSLSLQDTDFSQRGKPATIKVLIERRAQEALIEVKGRYAVYNPLDGTQVTSGVMSKRQKAKAAEYGIEWGEMFPGLHQIRIVPYDTQGSILVGGIQYRGCVEVYAADGKINVVNEVDIESFLKSTMTAEFSEPLDTEVMNALAIVARTSAYYLALKSRGALWHIEAEEAGYQGNAVTMLRPFVDRAIENTRHAVLTLQSAPFFAAWTQNSAGSTADIASIFRKAIASPAGVRSPIAAKDRPRHHWSFTAPKAALAKTANLPNITAIDLYLAPSSEKVYAVRLCNGEQTNDVDFFTLQKVLGKNRLKSTDFTVSVKGDQVVFSGYGEGPGVGLCLYSAAVMARKGEKADKILSYFFPGTQLEKLKSIPVQN